MRRHKKWTISLLAVLVLAMVASIALLSGRGADGSAAAGGGGAGGPPPPRPPPPQAHTPAPSETTLAAVTASADFAVLYSSVDQLKEAADLIVSGEIVDVSYLDFNSTAYTKVTFRVAESLKGKAAVGDKITIAEVGGITSMATINGDKFGPATQDDANTKVKVELEGAPLSQVGDQCTYFLGTGSIGVLPGPYYVPLGAFQGRFTVENGIAKRFVPADWRSPNYSALSTTKSALDQAVLAPAAE
jgi:hypothetical protein